MLRLREDTLFTNSKSKENAFSGILLGSNNENDGVKMSRKVAVIKIVTQPAEDETMVVGGKTYTFKNSAIITNDEISLGNLIGNSYFFANGTEGWIINSGWSIVSSVALHTPGAVSGSIASIADYRASVGGTVLVTDASHGLVTGNTIVISGTTNYNGTYIVTKVSGNTFYIRAEWKGTETGTWTTTASVQPIEYELFPKTTVGYTYTFGFGVSDRTAGSVQFGVGGVLTAPISTNGGYSSSITAITDGNIQFVPTADFDGSVGYFWVTEPHTDVKGLTAKNIADKINADTLSTLCTAYTGPNAMGLTTEIVLVANTIGITPTLTVDGIKITNPIALALTLTEAQLENTDYWKKNILTEVDVKPTVLVERNAGTFHNFLY